MKKRVALFGSTGSIGRSSLDVISRHKDRFAVVGLVAGKNLELFAKQLLEWNPRYAVLKEESDAQTLRTLMNGKWKGELAFGEEGMSCLAENSEVDFVLSAIVGCAGLAPTYAAICAGKTVALANKESLVAAGVVMMEACKKSGATLLPVDSEHSAIHQALRAGTPAGSAPAGSTPRLKKITLTASGGPFRNATKEEIAHATIEQALKHPKWEMGNKITIDSATMMNKGLEMIEARWLFDLKPNQIAVKIHPQSIIHSLVEFEDGSWLAQMGLPDMRTPIAYALAYPDRMESGVPPMDLTKVSPLTFEEPDEDRFPALRLAREALVQGESYPCVLNAANEIAVGAFLQKKISFPQISSTVEKILQKHSPLKLNSLATVLEMDRWARETTKKECSC